MNGAGLMKATRFLETPVQHGSDYIRWYDASGFNDSGHRQGISQSLDIRLHQAPRDVSLHHRRGISAIWRKTYSGATVIVNGRAYGDQLASPNERPYEISGEVHDPSRTFNSRLFSLTAGNAQGHELALYRSPLGTQLHSAGGLRGSIIDENGNTASWALVSVSVSPSLGAPINFIGQADAHGDFVLPLTRLPTLSSSAPSPTYSALMHVRADETRGSQISNPDNYVAFHIGDFSTPSTFNSSVPFDVFPGSVQHLSSAGSTKIIIQSI